MSWQITFLGSVSATREGKTLTRFESSRVVALLARLALFPQRAHPREELVELLWPEVERDVALVRLRHTLRTLRQPLELGLPAGSVLIADRLTIRINPEAITTDVAQFERALKQKDLQTARNLYTGELLPGLYDDWILEERYRLEALAEQLQATPEQLQASLPSQTPTPSSGDEVANRQEGRPKRGTNDGIKKQGDGIKQPEATLALPPYLTAFFGRQAEQESIAAQLTRSRLVTLTGLGGTGKTRLSVEILRSLAKTVSHAAFVALGECLVASQIPGRFRDALGLPAVSADPLEQVAWALSDSPALLVLDNFEQLVDSGGAELVEILLARLPQLTLLVTSRRALSIPGERLFPLEPLPQTDALALFLDRVQASRPGFHLTAGNQDDVFAVCQGLEGIPLSLELAAARIRAFSPSEMRSELESRFAWLARTGLRGDKDDRHRSLSAALDWSWRLLPVSQQRFLANLALFRASFTCLDAASVTGYVDARDRLEGLVSDSLVQSAAAEGSGETRYTFLETVREFALSRLEQSEVARAEFRKYYLANPTRDENTTTAWEYALQDQQGDEAHALAILPNADWSGRLGVGRTRDFLERTLVLSCTDVAMRLQVSYALAECLARVPDRKGAMALMAEALMPLEALGGELLAEGLKLQAIVGQYDSSQETTLALLERCISLTQDPLRRADALRLKGSQFLWTESFELAEPLFNEAERLYDKSEVRGKRILTYDRAHLARRRGLPEEALRLTKLAIAQAEAAGDSAMVRNCQANLPPALAQLELIEEAVVQSRRCVEVEAANGDQFQLLSVLWNLACYFPYVGQAARAAKLISAVAALWESVVRPLSEEELSELAELRTELAESLGAATLATLWDEGMALTLKEAVALALATD